ncbi:4'-phosphopantetheinyl transferase family protein [Shewanella surugensis]|uniref:Enterobactin synthase component D n=1 Tax=Shewanella surugensis TaxID=212020 RepID=A0ABT0LDM2_9GAMM|nr:4'-phosphopantetheinyl transferase superfamily protein [Shewanella surugensis]MCL1125679.1 4'-phosphopantetheinyl transferase superfamily protein [Shewanella surugensis]
MLSRPTSLQQHFPHMTDVILLSCQFDINAFQPSLFSQHQIALPSKLEKAVPKRQAEFLAGRFLAKTCFTDLSLPYKEIINGSDRCPIWPKNIIGTITHSNETAACAITTAANIVALGIDLEYDINVKTCEDIYKSIINEQEETFLRSLNCPFNQVMTLVFSAKESIYKALYPKIKQFFNFDAVTITALNLEQQVLTLELSKDWSSTFQQGQRFECHYLRFERSFLTTITVFA